MKKANMKYNSFNGNNGQPKTKGVNETREQQIAAFFEKFPNNATCWSQATDEMREAVHSIRTNHNELTEGTVADWEPIESMDFYSFHTPSAWNTKAKAEFWRLWNLTTEQAREATFDYLKSWWS